MAKLSDNRGNQTIYKNLFISMGDVPKEAAKLYEDKINFEFINEDKGFVSYKSAYLEKASNLLLENISHSSQFTEKHPDFDNIKKRISGLLNSNSLAKDLFNDYIDKNNHIGLSSNSERKKKIPLERKSAVLEKLLQQFNLLKNLPVDLLKITANLRKDENNPSAFRLIDEIFECDGLLEFYISLLLYVLDDDDEENIVMKDHRLISVQINKLLNDKPGGQDLSFSTIEKRAFIIYENSLNHNLRLFPIIHQLEKNGFRILLLCYVNDSRDNFFDIKDYLKNKLFTQTLRINLANPDNKNTLNMEKNNNHNSIYTDSFEKQIGFQNYIECRLSKIYVFDTETNLGNTISQPDITYSIYNILFFLSYSLTFCGQGKEMVSITRSVFNEKTLFFKIKPQNIGMESNPQHTASTPDILLSVNTAIADLEEKSHFYGSAGVYSIDANFKKIIQYFQAKTGLLAFTKLKDIAGEYRKNKVESTRVDAMRRITEKITTGLHWRDFNKDLQNDSSENKETGLHLIDHIWDKLSEIQKMARSENQDNINIPFMKTFKNDRNNRPFEIDKMNEESADKTGRKKHYIFPFEKMRLIRILAGKNSSSYWKLEPQLNIEFLVNSAGFLERTVSETDVFYKNVILRKMNLRIEQKIKILKKEIKDLVNDIAIPDLIKDENKLITPEYHNWRILKSAFEEVSKVIEQYMRQLKTESVAKFPYPEIKLKHNKKYLINSFNIFKEKYLSLVQKLYKTIVKIPKKRFFQYFIVMGTLLGFFLINPNVNTKYRGFEKSYDEITGLAPDEFRQDNSNGALNNQKPLLGDFLKTNNLFSFLFSLISIVIIFNIYRFILTLNVKSSYMESEKIFNRSLSDRFLLYNQTSGLKQNIGDIDFYNHILEYLRLCIRMFGETDMKLKESADKTREIIKKLEAEILYKRTKSGFSIGEKKSDTNVHRPLLSAQILKEELYEKEFSKNTEEYYVNSYIAKSRIFDTDVYQAILRMKAQSNNINEQANNLYIIKRNIISPEDMDKLIRKIMNTKNARRKIVDFYLEKYLSKEVFFPKPSVPEVYSITTNEYFYRLIQNNQITEQALVSQRNLFLHSSKIFLGLNFINFHLNISFSDIEKFIMKKEPNEDA